MNNAEFNMLLLLALAGIALVGKAVYEGDGHAG